MLRLRAGLILCAILVAPLHAHAQGAVQQSGAVVAGHLSMYIGNGRVIDAGGPTTVGGAPQNSIFPGTRPSGLGLVNSGQSLALWSGYASAAYSELKFGFDGSGNALLSLSGQNGAAAPGCNWSINGALYPCIGTGAGNMVGSSPTVANDVVLWNNAAGTATKGTGGDFGYSAATGFTMGYGAASPNAAAKLQVQAVNVGAANAPFGIFGHLDDQASNGAGTNPNGIYADIWYDSPTAFTGLGAGMRANAYTIPQLTTTIGSAGSGYTNGDTVTIAGGTCTTLLNFPPSFKLTVAGGTVTAATRAAGDSGACTVYPTNPASVTGGTGSGLTLNLTNTPVTVNFLVGVYGRARHTALGTVTDAVALFADGAYNAGGGTTTNNVGLWLQPPYDNNATNSYGIYVPSNIGAFSSGTIGSAVGVDISVNPGGGANLFKVSGSLQAGTSQTCAAQIQGGGNAQLQSAGANCFLFLNAAAGGQVNLAVNGQTGAVVNAPASAVNYVSMSGAATGNPPTINAGGSDTNIDLQIGGQGSGVLKIGNAAGFTANGAVATALSSVGPTGSHTTVQKWLTIKDSTGAPFYIPAF